MTKPPNPVMPDLEIPRAWLVLAMLDTITEAETSPLIVHALTVQGLAEVKEGQIVPTLDAVRWFLGLGPNEITRLYGCAVGIRSALVSGSHVLTATRGPLALVRAEPWHKGPEAPIPWHRLKDRALTRWTKVLYDACHPVDPGRNEV